jgi:hypothetical protein
VVLGQPGDTLIGVARALYRYRTGNGYSLQPRNGGRSQPSIPDLRQRQRAPGTAQFRRLPSLCCICGHARTAALQGRRFRADRCNGAPGLDANVSNEAARTKHSEMSPAPRGSRRRAARGRLIHERPERESGSSSLISRTATPETPRETPAKCHLFCHGPLSVNPSEP